MTAVGLSPSPLFAPPWSPGRCAIMGIVNVTPDSFSDGGLFYRRADAVAQGLLLAADGADIVDVGGESTRPGASRVTAAEEAFRVLPVVRELAAAGVRVSVDTMRARVAEAAVESGATVINDVSGGLADPNMARVVAGTAVTYVAMHWRAHSDRMAACARYGDVVSEVVDELRARLRALTEAGVHPDQIVLDPGLGFAKTAKHNWSLLTNLGALRSLGRPILVGASRKSFLGEVLASGGHQPPPTARDDATLAVSALAAAEGASCVRVHDVRSTVAAVRVAAAWRAARPERF
jgi:dihydropteroate synthase